MSKGTSWDLTSLHSLEGAAEWIRKRSDAVFVLVVRGSDVAFAVAPDAKPKDCADVVELVMPEAIARAETLRAEKKAKAQHGPGRTKTGREPDKK
jgi:hypothetical protein